MRMISVLLIIIFSALNIIAQNIDSLEITINDDQGEPIAFASIFMLGSNRVFYSDLSGKVHLALQAEDDSLEVQYLGFESQVMNLSGIESRLSITMIPSSFDINVVTITGTKTFKRKSNSNVIVNVIDKRLFDDVQACQLAEGLNFQPGLRVETNCQTCNYTQLRINGLPGSYSQVLINGRPIFSPLTGLYGLEQIPASLIERVEVIRGGGSSLYGSSAIGGTVNIMTKIPKTSGLRLKSSFQSINQRSNELNLDGHGSWINKKKTLGVTFFGNYRHRMYYDHNNDNFSELPEIYLHALGGSLYYQPTEFQKLELSGSFFNEYRFGGDMTTKDLKINQQAEERDQNVHMLNIDYQINNKQKTKSFIAYAGLQRTTRTHFTGVLPDDIEEALTYQDNLPFGNSTVQTSTIGTQVNIKLSTKKLGIHIFTHGLELNTDYTMDHIKTYNYLVDQTTINAGTFLQHDWQLTPEWSLLTGTRVDYHNFVNKLVVNPRMSVMYKPNQISQIRLGYATGFRAPQAFDTDLHIAFAGGGISRISIDPLLKNESSRSINLSYNYDHPREDYIYGYTIELFHTRLRDAFVLNAVGEDQFGQQFLKQNGGSSQVNGITIEGRVNIKKRIQLESGFTFQRSSYKRPIKHLENLEGIRRFVRTPDTYGFINFTFMPNDGWNVNLNYILTGSMIVPHLGGAINQPLDEFKKTAPFNNISLRLSRNISFGERIKSDIHFGIKNALNSYQNDFDIGKNRDSNYVYGPGLPRSYYIGFLIEI